MALSQPAPGWRPPTAATPQQVPAAPPVQGIPQRVQPAVMQPQQLATGVIAPVEAPEIEPFPSQGFYPSLLHIGPSGMGKSEAIGAALDVGLNVLVVLAEPKGATYVRRKPCVIQVCQPELDYGARYDRVMRFADELAAGKYREYKGQPFDAIALDGLTEIGDFTEARFANMSRQGSGQWDFYNLLAAKQMQMFRTIRDAAGIASIKASLPPILVMATCVEEYKSVGPENNTAWRWVAKLAGQKAGREIERHFETVWRYETGFDEQRAFEFRIWTQATPGRMGKSPPLLNVCERGPGAWLDPQTRSVKGWPHAGVMLARLLADPRSPYYREDAVARFAPLWSQA